MDKHLRSLPKSWSRLHLKIKRRFRTQENVSESLMEFTPQSLDAKRAKQTMRTLPYEEAKAGVSRVIERPLEEIGALSEWDLSFSEYIEEHKNSTLLFCWYAKYVAVVFSPADRHGIWVLQRENVGGKGKLPQHTVDALERIAKEKGLC
jgi:hypothetical protein